MFEKDNVYKGGGSFCQILLILPDFPLNYPFTRNNLDSKGGSNEPALDPPLKLYAYGNELIMHLLVIMVCISFVPTHKNQFSQVNKICDFFIIMSINRMDVRNYIDSQTNISFRA